jgi:hypothetical protein
MEAKQLRLAFRNDQQRQSLKVLYHAHRYMWRYTSTAECVRYVYTDPTLKPSKITEGEDCACQVLQHYEVVTLGCADSHS